MRPGSLSLFLVLGTVSVVGPATMDSYLPGLPQLARDLGASPSSAQLTVTTFLVGLAIGQVLAGPLSDVHGRRRPLIWMLAAFAIASLVCMLATNLASLAAMRLVQGTMAAAGMTIGRAVVRDLFSGAAAARYLSRLMLVTGVAPVLAPTIGGQILLFTSWRGVFGATALLGAVLVVLTARFLPETHPVSRRRAAGVRETIRSFASVLVDRRFVGFVVVMGAAGGAFIGYIAGSAFVLEEVYGASPQLFGLLFGINSVVLVVGAQINAYLLGKVSPPRLLAFGLGTMAVAAAGLLVVVAAFPGGSLLTVMPALSLLLFSWSFIQSNAVALALTSHPGAAGAASAVLGVSQYTCGAVAAPLVGIGGGSSGVSLGVVLVAGALIAVIALITLVRPAPRTVGARSGTTG